MPQIIRVSMLAENLCKHVEYMFLSSKKRTGGWFSRYGNLDESFTSIGRENIDLADRKCLVHLYTAIRERLTKVLPVLLIISKSGENTGLQVTDRVILFNLRNDIKRGRRSVAIFFRSGYRRHSLIKDDN